MNKLTSVLFSVLILMVVIVPNSVFASQSSWVYSDEMTSSRAAFGVATVNGNIYIIGGQNASALNKVEVYNSNTKKWTTKTSMTTARAAFGTAVVNGKIYTIGGYSGDAVNLSGGSHLSTVEEYDPINDVWTTKAPLPVARSWT
ncbi:Kelch repeat-containing protein, partial [Paenibacillus graminis]